MAHFPLLRVLLSSLMLFSQGTLSASNSDDDYNADQIEIVVGENRTMIKIVPEKGRAYYMVPADGAPHYESLDHKRKLYPQWVIMEW